MGQGRGVNLVRVAGRAAGEIGVGWGGGGQGGLVCD